MKTDQLKIVIDEKLDLISEQFGIIKTYTGKIPAIELDLLMANIRDLYELFVELEKENHPMGNVSSESFSTGPDSNNSGIISFEPISRTESPLAAELAEQEEEEKKVEPGQVESASEMPGPAQEEPKTKHFAPARKPKSSSQPVDSPAPSKPDHQVLDLFSQNEGLVTEKLKDKSDQRETETIIPSANIRDLKSVIGINEKFLFINELFEGSLQEYENAIGRLNACREFPEASSTINLLQDKYNWDPVSEVVRTFTSLVKRKF